MTLLQHLQAHYATCHVCRPYGFHFCEFGRMLLRLVARDAVAERDIRKGVGA